MSWCVYYGPSHILGLNGDPMTSLCPVCTSRDPTAGQHPFWTTFIHSLIHSTNVYGMYKVCVWGGGLTVPCGNKSLKLHFQPGIKIHSPKSLDLILMPLPPSNVTCNLLFGLLNLGFLVCEYLTTGEHRHWQIRKGVGPSHALEWFELPSFCWCM